MRAFEIITETDYVDELQGDLEDLLIAAKATDINTVSTEKVANQLKSMGYSVTPESLLKVLAQSPLVYDADVEEITLNSDNNDGRSPEENREIVQKLATKALG